MFNLEAEKKLASYISIGTAFVTLFLLTNTNSDPVNVTKLLVLGSVSMSTFLLSTLFGIRKLIHCFKPFLIVIIFFNLQLIVAALTSKSPFSQNYFGAYGRSNGLLTYALFSAMALASVLISTRESFTRIIYAFFISGAVNIIYCAWVLSFGDFIPWTNPYGNILGTFGNPDFISAFLGMFIAGSLAFIVSPKTAPLVRLLFSLSSVISLLEIINSHAIQGLVVSAVGLSIVVFYQIRFRVKGQLTIFIYVAIVFSLGILSIMGSLQKGPFGFLYKRSVSLRGSYWQAGLEMGQRNPLTGVGLDSYGDWYRRTRPPVALIDTPGINTTSNVAHNVVIDFFASGGFPLVIFYVTILVIGAVSILRVTFRNREYDRVFVALTAVWLCYEVQSFISINQIGLAVWGWVFTGLLVGYEFVTRPSIVEDNKKSTSKKPRRKAELRVFSPALVAGIGAIAGLLISLPPFLADSKWFSATNSGSVNNVETALAPSLFNPQNSFRYSQAVQLFENSNLPELALKYARIAVKFNPDYFDAWKQLYMLPQTSPFERESALLNMKRLDPNNPDVTATS